MPTLPSINRRFKECLFAVFLFILFSSVASTQDVVQGNTAPSSPVIHVPLVEDPEAPVSRFRRQFYQGIEFRAGALFDFQSGGRSLDQAFEEVRVSFGVPLLSLENILAVSPSFRIDHFNGPSVAGLDVPKSLFNVGVALLNRKKWSDNVSTMVLLTPSIRSDFETDRNAFRLFGLGLLNWRCRSDLTFSFGAVFLDRADIGILPAIGATWTPEPWWRVELLMPRPRVMRRLWKDSSRAEAWAYAGFNLGGNTWAVTRDSGMEDELSVRAIELQFGAETIRSGNRGWLIEGGYAFARKLEYERSGQTFRPDDALFFRGGWRF